MAMIYDSFLSKRALRRKPSAIRELQPLLAIPGMISLGGGNPTPSLFPICGVQLSLKTCEIINISNENIEKMQQYSPSYGIPALVEWFKNLQKKEHKLENIKKWEICITNGSQDGLSKAFDLLLDEGDYLLADNPMYSGSLSALQPIGVNIVGIKSDQDGLNTDELEKCLKNWSYPKKPKALYTVPTGQNPSGSTLSLARRQHLYKLASEHNFLILEDDPYFFLQFRKPEDYLPSLLSMDTEQRVLRFDSCSKIISSGLRIGWITGPKFLVDRIQIDLQGFKYLIFLKTTCLHASGISQIIVLEILQKWGEEGWRLQISKIYQEYLRRRDLLLKASETYLKGLAEWNIPSAGMFLWYKLLNVEDSNDLIKKEAVKEKILFVPGSAFSPTKEPSSYVRASYSTATPEEMEEAIKRLAAILKSYQEMKK